ncbi:MAG: formamidopyrimidine-DNA glycosylase [Myxococcales bacterium]|nr:formamidopyrimidine-DNA glycosylase [Myxococcales bacterium]
MPELPDITVYVERIADKVVGTKLEAIRLASPFVLRTFDPKVAEVTGKSVREIRRLGKRIVFVLEDDLFVVVHLMVAGRFEWTDQKGAKIPGKIGLLALDFERGSLLLREASSKKRASIHLVRGEAKLREDHDRGGVEPLAADRAAFVEVLRRENHTLKRTLTDPRLFSGIGNAYSDEILHAAKLSPVRMSTKLDDAEIDRLRAATFAILERFTEALRKESLVKGFPEKVTAFREDMAVHGKYGKACPVCGDPVQRIKYADNECNYCATCQTGGKLLADRSLSRLMKEDWPRSLEELEEKKAVLRGGRGAREGPRKCPRLTHSAAPRERFRAAGEPGTRGRTCPTRTSSSRSRGCRRNHPPGSPRRRASRRPRSPLDAPAARTRGSDSRGRAPTDRRPRRAADTHASTTSP